MSRLFLPGGMPATIFPDEPLAMGAELVVTDDT
jgi:hypothetical protein